MAPEQKQKNAKRKGAPKDTDAANSNKRRKVQNAKSALKVASADDAHTVRLDELTWKEVAMPDQLDDYEGFFGLEEVEGVEVVRDADTGTISYMAQETKSNPLPQGISKKDLDTYNAVKAALEKGKEQASAPEEEWAGFSESESLGSNGKAMNDTDENAANADLEPDSEEEDNQEGELGSQEELGSLSFAGLADEDLDEGVDTIGWQILNLSPETLSSISKLGFSRPTPIQCSSIPEIIAGHDVIGKASTGSGKTLAFGIPILESYLRDSQHFKISKEKERPPSALILAPTRELAHQINKHLTALCTQGTFSGPRMATITGGLSIQKQQRQLTSADIIIGTPGRLWEVMGSGRGVVAKLKKIKFLVVDEADRLLSDGHFKEVEEILNALDRVEKNEEGREEEDSGESDRDGKQRQTLVFSATFQKGLQQKLAGKSKPGGELMSKQESMEYLLKKLHFREDKPKFIDVNPASQMASGLKEGLVECAGTEKDLYLYALLLLHPRTRTLIFTNSISAVRRLSPFLQNLSQPVQSLHSNMPQKARLRAVERFTASDSSILVATDVAARGLDIPGVQLVIHYHLPRTADMYVHRSGRTARAEKKGISILICAPEEVTGVRRLIAKVHAQQENSTGATGKRMIRSIDIDRRVVARLKPRATLAKKIADVGIAKEKGNASDQIFAQAAEDLGVDYDSEDFEEMGGGRRGRGNARKKKEREDRGVGKEQVGAWRAELRALLAVRVNVGVSERYITGGSVDVNALLQGERGEFLGLVRPLEIDED